MARACVNRHLGWGLSLLGLALNVLSCGGCVGASDRSAELLRDRIADCTGATTCDLETLGRVRLKGVLEPWRWADQGLPAALDERLHETLRAVAASEVRVRVYEDGSVSLYHPEHGDLAKWLLESGWAISDERASLPWQDAYRRAQQAAIGAKRGLWQERQLRLSMQAFLRLDAP